MLQSFFIQWYSSFYLLRQIYLFFFIIVYLDMVNDRRRRPKCYPLNIRHHGYSFQDLQLAERFQLFSEFFLAKFLHDPTIDRRNILLICLLGVLVVSGNLLAIAKKLSNEEWAIIAFAGWKKDHMKQNESHLFVRSFSRLPSEVGNAIQCNTKVCTVSKLVVVNTISLIRCLTNA